MHIPTQYLGRWSGKITDATLMKPYLGEIVIGVDDVDATYSMVHGTKIGKLSLHCESDGFLVLKEVTASFTGTLVLYLDASSSLKCVWRRGSRFNSEATMTRSDAVNPQPK